jgi:hypothetical protein
MNQRIAVEMTSPLSSLVRFEKITLLGYKLSVLLALIKERVSKKRRWWDG